MNQIRLHVWGDYACFTRPEMKVERVSYDVITPSAARGILAAVHWKPAIRWVIDRIYVLKASESRTDSHRQPAHAPSPASPDRPRRCRPKSAPHRAQRDRKSVV